MKHFCVAAILLVVALSSHTARADGEEFARPGAYLAVGASRSFNLIDEFDVDDAWGANARVGYRFNEWISAEAEYEWLDDLTVKFGSFDAATIQIQAASANLRVSGPFGRFQPYLLAGLGAVFVDAKSNLFFVRAEDDTAMAVRIGGGLDFYVTPHFLLNLGAETVFTEVEVFGESTDYVTLQFGFGYRF